MACANHGLDQDQVILLIEKELRQAGFRIENDLEQPTQPVPSVQISSNTLIGDILSKYPASQPLFQKHFGAGCFDCPGQAYESVEMACQVHGINSKSFLRDLNEALSG
jgi:hybrid cluster-associated redox disulfide protein